MRKRGKSQKMIFRFESPFALLLLLLIPWILARRASKSSDTPALPLSTAVSLATLPGSWRSLGRERLMSLLLIGSMALFVFALARPQSGTSFTETEASGRDIMLALDLSGSMHAMDFVLDDQRVNRLAALKSVVSKFIEDRKGDRLGVVVFGDEAFTQCPLTRDFRTVKAFLDALELGMAGQGTAIGEALGIGIKRIRDLPGDSKVVVLVTDGKNNSGSLSPLEAANLAKELEIRVHTIGIGGNAPAPFPVRTPFGGVQLITRPTEFDAETLREISRITGGKYFNAKNTEGLQDVYEEINKLEQREEKELHFVEYKEQYLPFLLLALVLYSISHILDCTVLRVRTLD